MSSYRKNPSWSSQDHFSIPVVDRARNSNNFTSLSSIQIMIPSNSSLNQSTYHTHNHIFSQSTYYLIPQSSELPPNEIRYLESFSQPIHYQNPLVYVHGVPQTSTPGEMTSTYFQSSSISYPNYSSSISTPVENNQIAGVTTNMPNSMQEISSGQDGSHYSDYLLMSTTAAPFPYTLKLRDAWHKQLPNGEVQHFADARAYENNYVYHNSNSFQLGASSYNPNFRMNEHVSFPCKILTFLLQKELKASDVNNLKRIILPKRDAERRLPSLLEKSIMKLTVRDTLSTEIWQMKFKFWQNNKGRMYVLENTGGFINKHGLKAKDYFALYKDENGQYYIWGKKNVANQSSLGVTSATVCHVSTSLSQSEDGNNVNQTAMQEGTNINDQLQRNMQQPINYINNSPHMEEVQYANPNPDKVDLGVTMQDKLKENKVFDENGLSLCDLRPWDTGTCLLK